MARKNINKFRNTRAALPFFAFLLFAQVCMAASWPDLELESISFQQNGRIITASAVVRNVGETICELGYLEIYIYSAGGQGARLKYWDIPSLLPGEKYVSPEYERRVGEAGKYELKFLALGPSPTLLFDRSFGADSDTSNNAMIKEFFVENAASDPPKISIEGPSELMLGQEGVWRVSGVDDRDYSFDFSVAWENKNPAPITVSFGTIESQDSGSARVMHAFSKPGVYYPVFSLRDSDGIISSKAVPLTVLEKPALSGALELSQGWNMVSMPFSTSLSREALESACGPNVKAFWYASGGYKKAYSLEPGKGYWIGTPQGCKVEMSGESYSSAAADLFAGWNLVPAPGTGVALKDYMGDCVVLEGLWHYTPHAVSGQPYFYSDRLYPMKAYWLKVASPCTLKA